MYPISKLLRRARKKSAPGSRRTTLSQIHGYAGATENAGVENAIRSKMQGWKNREKIAGVENAGVENAGVENAGVENTGVENTGVENAGIDRRSGKYRSGKCGSGKCGSGKCGSRLVVRKAEPILYSDTALSYFLNIVYRLLSE